MYYIGIDLGGTNVAAGVTDKEGHLLGKASIPCPRGSEAIADAMAESARLAVKEAGVPLEECASVGVASPGNIDPEAGIVFHAFNLELHNVPLAQMVSDRLGGIPTLLENDANAAALGEFVAGAGKGKNSLVAITLGTGVGSGAVLEGKLYTGFNYAAFESGHTVIHRGGAPLHLRPEGLLGGLRLGHRADPLHPGGHGGPSRECSVEVGSHPGGGQRQDPL